MRLLELTPEEAAFLATAEANDLSARLTRRLAATLAARLRLPLQLDMAFVEAPVAAPAQPLWQPDAAFATLWLTRRLGGQRLAGAACFVPSSLLHTLDAALAEAWLDGAAAVPPALAWTLTCGLATASFAVHLPPSETDMTRWARGVIRDA